jgi:predicted RNA-binding Zn-ribbon protein involved in translation (DUF1610 family)
MKSSQAIFLKNYFTQKCPSCGASNSLRRSKARTFNESLIKKFTFFRTFRCKDCGWRGYLSTLSINKPGLKYLFFYLALALVVAFVVETVLARLAP